MFSAELFCSSIASVNKETCTDGEVGVTACEHFCLFFCSSQTAPHWLWREVMSRHHHRFERDYRAIWDRRDRTAHLHNGVTGNACSAVGPSLTNGNNRPGLLPLPVIPSLLPTPVTIAVTTSSNELGAKRAGAPISAPAVKVGTDNILTTLTSFRSFFTLAANWCQFLSWACPSLFIFIIRHYANEKLGLIKPEPRSFLTVWGNINRTCVYNLSGAGCQSGKLVFSGMLVKTH